jgi:uncharacterized protein YndB with AHSA1/START domain
MANKLIAKASTTIDAPPDEVWKALVTPEAIREYMFGTTVESTWAEGSTITWKGEWEGKQYEDKGIILRYRPEHVLQYSHFSPLSGLPDTPENYHTVTVELAKENGHTRVSLSQDNNANEQARSHSVKNWKQMLAGLKQYAER